MAFVLSWKHSLLSPDELERRRHIGAENATRWLNEAREKHAAWRREAALEVARLPISKAPEGGGDQGDPTQAPVEHVSSAVRALQSDSEMMEAPIDGDEDGHVTLPPTTEESGPTNEELNGKESDYGEQQQLTEELIAKKGENEHDDAVDVDRRSRASSTPSQIAAFSPRRLCGLQIPREDTAKVEEAEHLHRERTVLPEPTDVSPAGPKSPGQEDHDDDYVDDGSSVTSTSTELTKSSDGVRKARLAQGEQTLCGLCGINLEPQDLEEHLRRHATEIPPGPCTANIEANRRASTASDDDEMSVDVEPEESLIVQLPLPQPFLSALANTAPGQAKNAVNTYYGINAPSPNAALNRPPPQAPQTHPPPPNPPGDLPTPTSQYDHHANTFIANWLSAVPQNAPTATPAKRYIRWDYDLTSDNSDDEEKAQVVVTRCEKKQKVENLDENDDEDVTVTSWQRKWKGEQVVIDLTED